MKATIEFDDRLYRQLKIEAARRGRTIRDLVDEGVRHVLNMHAAAPSDIQVEQPAWFGALRSYAANAHGDHDLRAIRRSIARGRAALE